MNEAQSKANPTSFDQDQPLTPTLIFPKLSKKQRAALERILYDLQRGYDYIHDARIVTCLKEERATTTLHFTREQPPSVCDDGNGTILYPVTKHSSDIVGLDDALRAIKRLLRVEE